MAKHVRLVYKQKPWALEVLAMAEASLTTSSYSIFIFLQDFFFVVIVFVLSV